MLSGDMSDNNKVRAYEDGKVTNLTIVGLPAISSPSIMSTTSSTRSLAQWNIAIYEDDDAHFTEVLKEAEAAIDAGILPSRIPQGSSGSYFVKNSKGENIGVFKPRDEEPYGRNNPKWGKCIQRHCCCCCFGRACLLPNTGYLSEAGAFIVDKKLGLSVVPKTKVIRMASTTFHYGKIRRGKAHAKATLANRFPAVGRRFNRIGLPLKIGSFQLFVNGYKDATNWLHVFETDPLPEDASIELQSEFERLVILDYVIRNTDRGANNWLMKYSKESKSGTESKSTGYISTAELIQYEICPTDGDNSLRKVKVAAIDNGLAFPFKHPDEIRAYPFHWAKLQLAKTPFSKASKDKYLPKICNIDVIEELCCELYCLFSLDKRFQYNMFEKQMSVMRGQLLNLANALRDGKSPAQLAQMPNVRVLRAIDIPSNPPNHQSLSLKETNSQQCPRTMKISPANTLVFDDDYKPEYPKDHPLFTTW